MRTLFLLFASLMSLHVEAQKTIEMKEAFEFLNQVRANPGKFNVEVNINMDDIKAIHDLKWNDTLAKVAQAKAEDMVKRDYFDHVDPDGNGINIRMANAGYKMPAEWTKDKASNFFESIAAGKKGVKESIIQLLYDGGAMPHSAAGHRVHLLGMNDFYSNFKDVGIGHATGGKWGYCTVVIIAKHNW